MGGGGGGGGGLDPLNTPPWHATLHIYACRDGKMLVTKNKTVLKNASNPFAKLYISRTSTA